MGEELSKVKVDDAQISTLKNARFFASKVFANLFEREKERIIERRRAILRIYIFSIMFR